MFELDQVVPWGRSFNEYVRMFALSDEDLGRTILGCGDGPASFNAGATQRGHRVVSCDPLYRFGKQDIEQRIAAIYEQVMDQARRNADDFVWGQGIRDLDELGTVRTAAMQSFLADYDRENMTAATLTLRCRRCRSQAAASISRSARISCFCIRRT